MSMTFLDHIKAVEDHRVPGMTTYPLDEVLLTILVGLLCRMEDFDEIAMFGEEQLDWLRRFLPFRNGVAPAQTLRRVLRALDPKALAGAFSSWVASLQAKVSGVIAIDGKTLRGTKKDKSGGRYRTHPQRSLSGGSLGPTRAGPSPAKSRRLPPAHADFVGIQRSWKPLRLDEAHGAQDSPHSSPTVQLSTIMLFLC